MFAYIAVHAHRLFECIVLQVTFVIQRISGKHILACCDTPLAMKLLFKVNAVTDSLLNPSNAEAIFVLTARMQIFLKII